MLASRIASRAVIAFALSLAVCLSAVPAFGATAASVQTPREPISSGAMLNGTPLTGMSEADARYLIAAASTVPTLTPVIVTGDGKRFTFPATGTVSVDVERMLAQAYATTDTTPFEVAPSYAVSSTVVARWSTTIARKIDRNPVNAKRRVSKRKLVVSAEKTGRKVDQAVTRSRIRARLIAEVTAPGVAVPEVKVAYKVLKPKVTRKNIGKAILVVLGTRRVHLYSGTKVEKSYRCAIGTRSHPTPVGTFKVTRKAKNPTWYNPGSAWARNMPARLSGASSPLGTRAIYLSAPGIRIHGTKQVSSIGRAASHGCLRMTRRDVENLYPRVPVGIKTYIVK